MNNVLHYCQFFGVLRIMFPKFKIKLFISSHYFILTVFYPFYGFLFAFWLVCFLLFLERFLTRYELCGTIEPELNI